MEETAYVLICRQEMATAQSLVFLTKPFILSLFCSPVRVVANGKGKMPTRFQICHFGKIWLKEKREYVPKGKVKNFFAI